MILLALLVAAAPAAETPRAYMERVYASYRNKNFSPFDHPERYFAPKLLAAIKEDARLAKGEVGYVDGDPICQCQDTDGLHAKIARVTGQGTAKALAEVILDFTDSTARRVRFSLVRTNGGWRIADVSSADEPSFLAGIEKSNREMRAKH
jgi:Protein of unknown function (DUF3828)